LPIGHKLGTTIAVLSRTGVFNDCAAAAGSTNPEHGQMMN